MSLFTTDTYHRSSIPLSGFDSTSDQLHLTASTTSGFNSPASITTPDLFTEQEFRLNTVVIVTMAGLLALPPAMTALPTLPGIPLEVRRLILWYVFVRDRVGIPANNSIFCSPRSSQLLRCSRQLYDEGLPLLMEENTFHYIIDPDHEEYPAESVIGKNAAMIKKIEMYHSFSEELLSKHTSATHFTINLTTSYSHKATSIADDRRQTAHKIIFAPWFIATHEQLCRLWFESGWFESIGDIKIRVINESGPVPPKQTVHEVGRPSSGSDNTDKTAVHPRYAAGVHHRNEEQPPWRA